MSSFRIMDTKFRILKGGKIGLAMSIAMIGGMIFGGTNLNATMTVDGSTTSSTTFYSNSGTWYGGWYTSSYGYNRDSYILSNTFAATTGTNITLGDGAKILSMTTGSQAASAINPYTYNYGAYVDYNQDNSVGAAGQYAGVYYDSYQTGITNSTYYPAFGWTTAQWTGATQPSDGTVDRFYYTYTGYSIGDTTGYTTGSAASDAGYAISAAGGTVTLNGNNTIDGSATATTFDVIGDNNDFNGAVSANNIYLNGDDNNFASTVNASGFINIGGNNNTFAGNVTTGVIQYGVAGSVAFTNGADLTGNVSFGGNDGIFTLGDGSDILSGNINTTSSRTGTLIFNGTNTIYGSVGLTAAIKEIQVNSTRTDIIQGSTKANYVNLNAAGTIAFGGGLDTRLADGALSTVDFNNYDGTVQIGNGGSLYGNVVTDTNNNGTLTMISGTQSITGQIGTSADKIKTLNIGGANTGAGLDTSGAVFSTTTANGHIYATDTFLNNNSTTDNSSLIMATGYNLDSIVKTDVNGAGILTLAGGEQNVTGDVGTDIMRLDQVNSGATSATSNFLSDVYADTVSNIGMGTTNFSNDVVATTINVLNGISNFTNNVSNGTNVIVTTTNIGTGVANFNTNETGITTSNLVFTADKTNFTTSDRTTNVAGLGSATANLMNGLTGNINFAGKNAVVNVWHEPITWADPNTYNSGYIPATITGNITTTTNNTGIVNFRGAGIIDGTVGASNMGIAQLNINTNDEQSGRTGFEWKEVVAVGDIYTGSINLKNDGTLTLEDFVDITGTNSVVALTGAQQVISTDVDGTGRLNFNGSSIVTGVVGANDSAIGTIDAMADGSTVVFNNMVYVDTLWAFDNRIILNGQSGLQLDGTTAGTSSNSTIAGMKGTINFDGNGAGDIQIGDNVNLTTGITGIQFIDANLATLTFNGNSTVTGVLGGNTDGRSTFAKIYAGEDGKVVTFTDDVHVMEGGSTPATFYVNGTGTVNFQGNLYGDLVYNGDGVVNVSNGKSIFVNTVPVAVTTITDGIGTLNYLGSTTLDTDIGTTNAMVKSVTFNSASNNVVQNIGHNVYADTVTIGGISGNTAISLVDVTGTYDYAGATTIKEYIAGTAANITSNVTLGGNLVIANTTSAINFGTSHVTVGMNHDELTPGAFTTNNGAMSFTVNTQDITGLNQAASTSTNSGQVTTAVLNMSGSEKVHINYVGSLANNGTYTLISDTGTTGTGTYSHVEGDGKVTDNSFVIDTKIYKTVGSDLILTADRTASAAYTADELYVQKSQTIGHFSNNAAMTLASISADGSQTGDMIEVIQKLELDSFGYGNTQENLAVQVQKLAPIVNTSFAQTSIGATKLVTDTVGSRLSDVRGLSSGEAVKDRGVWAKVTGSAASQDKVGQYDGYNLSSGGVVFGIDKELNNGLIIGLASGYTNTKTEQDDFRDGDKSTTNSYQLAAYASKTYDKAYLDGSLSYTKHNTDGQRSTAIDRVASYDVDADQLSAKINGGYNFILENKVDLTPFASLEYSTIRQNAYKETGAGAINLSVDDVTVNRGAAGLGVKISKEIKTEKNIYIPEFKLGANKYFGDDNVEVEAQFEQGNKFVTRGADMTDVMYNAGLGLKTKFTEDTSVSLSTDYERSNDGDFQGVNGQLTFRMQF